jgi:hypothetical protein
MGSVTVLLASRSRAGAVRRVRRIVPCRTAEAALQFPHRSRGLSRCRRSGREAGFPNVSSFRNPRSRSCSGSLFSDPFASSVPAEAGPCVASRIGRSQPGGRSRQVERAPCWDVDSVSGSVVELLPSVCARGSRLGSGAG